MAAPIELILMRQLAGHLATPIFVVDSAGNLLFFNEPAEELLGRRFDEAGPMPISEWSTSFNQRDTAGAPLRPNDQPLAVALRTHRPAHRTLWITGHDGVARHLGVTAFPLEGPAGAHFGAVAIFWQLNEAAEQDASRDRPRGSLMAADAHPQKAIELILTRQLAGYLAMPIIIADNTGHVLFYNQPVEEILGRRFAETGEVPLEEWMRQVSLFDEDGTLIPPELRPLPTVLREHRPVHRRLLVQGMDGRRRRIESTVFPLEGQSGRHLGGVIIFWELGRA